MLQRSTKVGFGAAMIPIAIAVALPLSRLIRDLSSAPGTHSAAQRELIHTADWYASNPQAMKVDEAKCEKHDREISMEACENIESAEQRNLRSWLERLDGGK